MAAKDENFVIASTNVDEAIATETVIEERELEDARLDKRWLEFCANAERYVAETTRTAPRVEQTA